MIEQTVLLPGYNWLLRIFYSATSDDADTILEVLGRLDCSKKVLGKAAHNLRSGQLNTGLTYSSLKHRCSVMVIGKASSPDEYWNTIDHERGHVIRHISNALEMDPDGEEVQYLAGDIASYMAPIARLFVCFSMS